jgi:hypothetical protein
MKWLEMHGLDFFVLFLGVIFIAKGVCGMKGKFLYVTPTRLRSKLSSVSEILLGVGCFILAFALFTGRIR